MRCNHKDCFTCPYPDCVADAPALGSERSRLTYEERVEHRRANQKRWYEAHKEERKAYQRKKYLERKAEKLGKVEG